MAGSIDIKYINPFLKSTIVILEMIGKPGGTVGKPSLGDPVFEGQTYLIQVGVTGGMRGQVIVALDEASAKMIASTMMMGMPVETLDEMACSALGELGNMIMGNAATLFSNEGIVFDITPPLSMFGKSMKLQADVTAIKVPIMFDGKPVVTLFICVAKE